MGQSGYRGKMTREMKDRLEVFHREGRTWPEIAGALGVTVDTVKYHGKQLGLTREQKRVTSRIRADIFRLKAKGMTNVAIARRLDFHVATINEALKGSRSRYVVRDDMKRDPVNQLLMRAWG